MYHSFLSPCAPFFLAGLLIYFTYGIWHSFPPSYHDNLSLGDLKSSKDELFDDSDQEVAVYLDDTELDEELEGSDVREAEETEIMENT